MECWNWTAIGVIATAAGALASAFAAGAAIWIGVARPSREAANRQKLRAAVACEILTSELEHCSNLVTTLLQGHEFVRVAFNPNDQETILIALECPALMDCLSDPEAYPAEVVRRMARVGSLLSRVRYAAKLERVAPAHPKELEALNGVLEKLSGEIKDLERKLSGYSMVNVLA